MGKVIATSPPSFVGSRMILQLLAAGREAHPMVGEPARPAEGDHDAGRLDAAAGCEFLDDRIRLGE